MYVCVCVCVYMYVQVGVGMHVAIVVIYILLNAFLGSAVEQPSVGTLYHVIKMPNPIHLHTIIPPPPCFILYTAQLSWQPTQW